MRPIDVERTGRQIPVQRTVLVDEYAWTCGICGHVGTGHESAEEARSSGDGHACADPLPFEDAAKPVDSPESDRQEIPS